MAFLKRLATDIIYLDYSKCFDTVCHSKLLYKLCKYGICGPAYTWLQNFLLNRTQNVRVNNCLSSGVNVVSGVPQGTVLGPILFVLYSADLPKVVRHSKLSLYADDTKVYKSIQNIADCKLLQADLNSIFNWANIWQMKLNPDKTKHLTIGSSLYKYTLNGSEIDQVDSINDVGIIVQSDLKFGKHCSSVNKRSHFVINIFKTFKNHDVDFYVNLDIKGMLVQYLYMPAKSGLHC